MKIIQLTREHIPLILALESHSGPDKPLYVRYDETALNFLFDNPEACDAVGILESNKLIGWGAYRNGWLGSNLEAGVYEVSSIVVDNNHRGKGLGKQILQEIIHRIKSSKEFKDIYLTVSPHNTAALLLYLKNGFVINGYKEDAYGPNTDRVYLSLGEAK